LAGSRRLGHKEEKLMRTQGLRTIDLREGSMRGDGDMTAQVLISHTAGTAEIADQVVQALQVMVPGIRIARSSLPGRAPEGGDDSLAGLKQQLAAAETVVALITGDALGSAEVPFQLGASWALGKRLLLLVSPEERSVELYLPMGHAETMVLGPESLIELARSLASTAGLQAEHGPASTHLLMELFPGWEGPQRDSTERAVPTLQPRGDDTQQMWLIDQAERTEPSATLPGMAAEPSPEAVREAAPQAVRHAAPEPAPEPEATREPAPEPEAAREAPPQATAAQGPVAGPAHEPGLEAAREAAPETAPEAPVADAVKDAVQGAVDEAMAAAPTQADAERPNLPSASVALKAGCAISDRAWHREEGNADGEAIDASFGSLLETLGSDWSALSRLGDVELWMETADNVLATLKPSEQHVRGWYDVGYQATLLLNLARRQLELEAPDEGLEARWQGAWALLRDAAWTAGLPPSALDELRGMLDNLRGPARDYTNLGRAQERVAGLADQADLPKTGS
jgi:hypothetical protein